MAINMLSLDGGGVRGLSTLLILQRIMYVLEGKIDSNVPRPLLPCNYFDMIAGTSTGGALQNLAKFYTQREKHGIRTDVLEDLEEEWDCIVRGDGHSEASEESLQGLLTCAAYYGRYALMKSLISSGVNPNTLYFGFTPLGAATFSENIKAATILLRHGADPKVRDIPGATSLIVIYRDWSMNIRQMAEILLAHRANVNTQESAHLTALNHGIRRNVHESTLEVLVYGGAILNSGDDDFKPPLHDAITKQYALPTIRLLVDHGADVNAVHNELRVTPLDLLGGLGGGERNEAVKEYLVAHGAKNGVSLRGGALPLSLHESLGEMIREMQGNGRGKEKERESEDEKGAG